MNATGKTRRLAAKRNWIATLALLCLLAPSAARAACSTPTGNAGDIFFSSTSNQMTYCNGTNWISMGSSAALGTLTTNDFCVATSTTQFSCTTPQVALASKVAGILPGTNGGSGINNASTITIGGNISFAGAFTTTGGALTLTATGATNVTLPTSGTLINTAVTSLSSLAGVGTITTGVWNGTTVGAAYGGIGVATLTQYGVLFGNGTGAIQATSAASTGTVLVGGATSPSFSASPSLTNLTLSGVEIITPGTAYTTTGSQNNVALGSFSTIRYTGAGTATFTGIVAGSSGQILYLHNTSASTLTLSNLSASSSAANQIVTGTGGDFVMAANSSVSLQYDGGASLWRLIGGVGGTGGSATPAGTTGQLQYNNANAFAASANLFWDITNNRLGIGTSTPVQPLTVSGNVDALANGYITEVTNSGSGTTLNELAKINTSGQAVTTATSDVEGAIGVVVGGAGTSGSAQIAFAGIAQCVFDGATTAGDYVRISSAVAGDCDDYAATRPAVQQTIGISLSTNGGGGTYPILLQNNTPRMTCAAGTTTVFLTTTGAGTWTVPACWNNSNNSVEVIGGGGGGGHGQNGVTDMAAGGGGAYSKITNLSLGSSSIISYSVGSGGVGSTSSNVAGTAGNDTWFNGASVAASSVGAKGGAGGNATNGLGGASGSGVGTTLYSGGDGSNSTTDGGGGGAAGPNGAGAVGGAWANNGTNGGAGGGGANGGTAGANNAITAGVGANGGGNGGTGGTGGSTGTAGAVGGNGTNWDASHGSGGGGGGGGSSSGASGGVGASGGLYGGGGSTGGRNSGGGQANPGQGAQGIIVIQYTN